MIVAYTYEADYHCPACATKRFGTRHGEVVGIDNEGNPVHPVFQTDEYELPLACGTCTEVIEESDET